MLTSHLLQAFMNEGFCEILPSSSKLIELASKLCTTKDNVKQCGTIMTQLTGYNPGNVNWTQMPKYLTYTPCGTSVQNMAHWAQVIWAGQVIKVVQYKMLTI